MVGASFTGSTIKLKVVDALEVPSFTVMVTVALPLWLAPGLIVTVRFAPLPPKVMLATGIRDGLLVDAVRVKFAAGVSLSPTVNGIGAVGVFSEVV